jgi:creatinine amidohydrolase/Fe(II)-dependent formamide hydrolase-like protein
MPKAKKAETMPPFADVRMELMSSRQVQEYLRRNGMVILPVGCFEMHGPLVPLGCDSFIDWAMGMLLARQWKCPCLPPIFYTFPGASGPWPGTVDISNRATIDYVQAVVMALLKGGFTRVVILASHGPLGAMMQCVIRDVFQATGHAVLHVQPYGTIMAKMEEAGVPFGEPGVVLASMKILGLAGAFDPASKADRPMEFPLPSIRGLRQCQAQMPWIFAKDYQHTGINRKLKASHADRIAQALAEAAQEMKDLPRHFARYQREMATLYKDRPWARKTIWTKTQ